MNDVTTIRYALVADENDEKIIVDDAIVVGREVECKIQIASPQISRYHAKVRVQEGKLKVEDLDSANGTFVNGKKIKSSTEVQVGDHVAFYNKNYRVTSAASGNTDKTIIGPVIAEDKTNIPQVQTSETKSAISALGPITKQKPKKEADLDQNTDEDTLDHLEQNKDSSTIFLNQNQKNVMSTVSIGDVVDNHSGPRLIVLTAPLRGKHYSLASDEEYYTWSIGRNEHAEIALTANSASRMHAWVTKMDSIFEIKEENATNGLIINGTPKQQAILAHNDIIQIGGTSFVFRSDNAKPHSSSISFFFPKVPVKKVWDVALKALAIK